MKKLISILILLCPFFSHAGIQKLTPIHKTEPKKESVTKNNTNNSKPLKLPYQTRFTQHEENYILYDFNGGEFDEHLDAQVSIRYYFSSLAFTDTPPEDDWDYSIFFSYTGEFDFFISSRNSGPVENRRFNPGIHTAFRFDKNAGFMEYRVSLEHESNGQDVNDNNTLRSQAHNIYQKNISNNITRAKAFDIAKESVSRESNFIGLGGVYRFNYNDVATIDCDSSPSCFDVHFKFRAKSFSVDNPFFWLEADDVVPDITEYQGTKISISNHFGEVNAESGVSKYGASLTYRTGQFNSNIGKRNTFDVSLFYNLKAGNLNIPLMVTYHKGYLSELYQFEKKTSYAMVGLNFIY
ncbi:MAG: phospholipase A [Colwellia sp.]|nr:phospholipase A [Colwellia sp.]